jgi:hypothetical protein
VNCPSAFPKVILFPHCFHLRGAFRLEAVVNLDYFNQGRSNTGGFVPGYFIQARWQATPLPKKDLNTGEPLTVLIVPLLRPAVVVHLLLWVRHPPNWLLTKLQSEGKMFPMVPFPLPPHSPHPFVFTNQKYFETDFKFCLEKSGKALVFLHFFC